MPYPTVTDLLKSTADLTEEELALLREFIAMIRAERDGPSGRQCKPERQDAPPGSGL